MNPLISVPLTSALGNYSAVPYEKVSVTREQLLTMREVCCDFDAGGGSLHTLYVTKCMKGWDMLNAQEFTKTKVFTTAKKNSVDWDITKTCPCNVQDFLEL